MVNTIWFQVDLIRFQKDFSVCTHLSQCLCWWWRRVLWSLGQRKPWRRDLQNYRKSSHWQQPRVGQSCHSEIKPILVKNKKKFWKHDNLLKKYHWNYSNWQQPKAGPSCNFEIKIIIYRDWTRCTILEIIPRNSLHSASTQVMNLKKIKSIWWTK